MAVQRQQAAFRVEIERAVDAVKGTKSNAWFRAVFHQGVLRKIGRGRGPRITDDAGRVLRPRGAYSDGQSEITRRSQGSDNRLKGWIR
jgi:hypothetical protein